ncbi:MAG: aminotransferase class V-fold PLP-dependent enzyme [Actinobacteria bacterium]|nr:aminotransferase class V-fold PLP-dependent enzyme [Actinomycetota bacterium]
MPTPTRDDFLLDPDLIFLNHGSFGAVPRVVQEEYERLQRAMERSPVAWLQRQATQLLAAARARVAAFVGAEADDIVLFPNPTTAVNMVARSLRLVPGDEVVASDHEYGAMNRTWRRLCQESGATYKRVHVPLPLTTTDDYIERVWSEVGPRTKVLFLDRLTSSTSLILPVDELCQRARAAGIISIVDGAHVPGHIPLDVPAIGCDLFTGAIHKWLCAPKGCSLLFARDTAQEWLQPLVTSWGWESDSPSRSQFIDYHEWQGTRDLSAFLAAPAAIEFCVSHDLPAVQAEGHRLALLTRERVNELTGLSSICPDSWVGQMVSIRLPEHVNPIRLKDRLFDDFRIEVPLTFWGDARFIRVSFAAYNTEADSAAVIAALRSLL